EYALAPQEVRTLRITPTTDFWFADDPDNGYRLRAGCAYVFLRSSRARHLDLQRLGLADEQTWLDEEANPPVTTAASGDEPTTSSQRGAVVQVTMAVDVGMLEDGASWEPSLRATLKKASQLMSSQCGVRFEAVDFRLWQSDPLEGDFDEVWRRFVSAVPAGPGKLAVGFTTWSLPDSPCSGFPRTAGPLTSHVLILAGKTRPSEDELLQPLLHGLGHYLGAAHSPEANSVMRPVLVGPSTDARAITRFDPINALAMALVGQDLMTAAPKGLAELSPRVRQRLVSVYATLAEAAPHDPLADRFSRLLSPAPVELPSRTEPIAPEPKGPDVRPTEPAPTAPRDGENPAITGPPDRSNPAADRAGILDEPDRSALPQALALALVLVAIPVVLSVWRVTYRAGVAQEPDGEELAPLSWRAMKPVDRAVWSAYLASLSGVAMLSATSLFPGQAGGFKAAAVLLSAGLATMAVAPLYPMIGPLVYLVLSYAVQGDDPAGARIEDSGALTYLPMLSAAALAVRFFRQRRRPRPPRGITAWVLLLMMAWIGLTAAGAVINGLPVSSNMVHRLGRFAQVLVLFLVTLYADVGLAELRLTSLVLALALFARVHLFHADVSLEQNLAMLAAVACPLLFVGAQTAPSRLARVGFYVMSGYFVSLVVYSQNRAAMVSLPVAAAVLLFASPHRKRALLIAAPLALVLAAWLPASGFVNRFAEIYEEGEFQGSAYYRLRIWTAGWHMAGDHAVLGVGPGNFERFVEGYDADLPSVGPHNSFVQMVAETGLPGVAIYVALILAASLQLASTVRQYREDWRGEVAGGVLAGLAAHVVTGCFLENPSLAATYVVLAIGLALAAGPVTRVYRERLYVPLSDPLAMHLAEFVVRLPRVVSGMPAARWTAPIRRPPDAEFIEVPSPSQQQDAAWWLRVLLVVDLLVTAAGSLAPFSFRPMNLRDAVGSYYRQMSQGVEFSDRSDWLANLLLFAPVGFLAMAVCCPRRRGARRILAGVLVAAGSLLLSSLIELAQVWFPSRTVNPNDVAAESLGAAAGAVGFLFGERFLALVAAFFARRNPLRTGEKLLLCYALAVIAYAVWPLDVTINPTDFASKLREGRIDFADWTAPGWFATFVISAALMAPIGVLLTTLGLPRGASARSWPALVAWGAGWLLAIEFCRLLVFNQSVGLMHLVGGAAGILLGGMAQRLLTGSR
ncbi:MAG TPA: O-antigen ligase family protein, partial [Pirellulales bacterium]|nr:O-antigen ligase family protein [Pirellulales bacterium]